MCMIKTTLQADANVSTSYLQQQVADRLMKRYHLSREYSLLVAGEAMEEFMRDPQYQRIIERSLISHCIILAKKKLEQSV